MAVAEKVCPLTDQQRTLAVAGLEIPRKCAVRMKRVHSLDDGHFPLDELISEGFSGLLTAARTWVAGGKITFAKWATYKVNFALRDHIRATLGSKGKGRKRHIVQPCSLEQTIGGLDEEYRPLSLKAIIPDRGPAPESIVGTADVLTTCKRIVGRYYPAVEAVAIGQTQAWAAVRIGVSESAVSFAMPGLLAILRESRAMRELCCNQS